ncbi:MAG: tetratricopeptide repeat protein, partial [Pyrinomonadaceae bacterium]|nr:tetratricopeptide repeat protein [Pyrinomonadaceae bacterium]
DQGSMLADVQATLDKAKDEPDNFQAQIKAGEMYSKIRRFDKALEYYEKAQKLKPNDFSANSILGNAYFDLKQYKKAETAYARALEIKPNDVAVRTDFGLTFYLREPGDYDRAVSEYRKALDIDPNHELTLQNLIVALNDMGEKEEAAKAIDRLRAVNPKNPVIEKFGK